MLESEVSLATRAAWLSYIGGYTQEQIAERLGVSRIKAHRLIAAAQEEGLIKVFVEGAPAECMALEVQLMRRHGLAGATVVPSLDPADSETELGFKALGAAAAQFLVKHLEKPEPGTIGVGHGRTLAAFSHLLPRLPRPDTRFVSLLGSLTRRSATNPFDVVHRLSERTGGEGYFLPVPFYADSVADRDVLMAQRSVQAICGLAREAGLHVVGIGNLAPDAHLRSVGHIDDAEYRSVAKAGGVGDLVGEFLRADGRPVDCEVNDRKLGLRLDDLRGTELVAVAGGVGKCAAIAAALASGVVTRLITDEHTAVALLGTTSGSRAASGGRLKVVK